MGKNDDKDGDFYERATRPAGRGNRAREESIPDDRAQDVTRPWRGDGTTDPRTRIHRPGGGRARSTEGGAADAHTSPSNEPNDPPTGWLVVIDGPGKGNAVAVGIGANAIGRNPDQRVPLAFGDSHISGESHALLVYDPESRRFYVNHGGGKNLTYVDGQLVMTPTELAPHAELRMGETRMRFVPLCGEQFDWSDT